MRKPLQVLSLSLSLPPYRGWAARNHNKAAAVAGPDPVSQPDGGGGRGRHRIGPVSQIAADGADGVDGRMTSLPIYLLRGERGARRNLICRTRLAYHVRDIHSTPKPIRGQALSFPIRICNELVQRFSPIKGVESWTLPDCRRYASKTA